MQCNKDTPELLSFLSGTDSAREVRLRQLDCCGDAGVPQAHDVSQMT